MLFGNNFSFAAQPMNTAGFSYLDDDNSPILKITRCSLGGHLIQWYHSLLIKSNWNLPLGVDNESICLDLKIDNAR